MFSLQIVDTDAFLEMPVSSQLLYFHLTMRADDEGFVGNPRKIMRMIGIQNDDFKILLAKRFILEFKSGVVVIKHWLIHNTIRMDRFNETTYKSEKNLIKVKENKAYTELATTRQPNGNQMEPQVKLSKVKLSKVSISAEAESENKKKEKAVSVKRKKKESIKLAEPAAEQPKFDGKKYIAEMFNDKQVNIRIIALFLTAKRIVPENEKQMITQLRRNLPAARDLSGYSGDRIKKTMIFLRDFGPKMRLTKWTLETVGKYIDDDLEQMKKTIEEKNNSKVQKVWGENIKI